MGTAIGLFRDVKLDGTASVPAEAAMRADIDLVEAARHGDRGAFGQLYCRFAPMVYGVLLARVPRSAAEDLVQDVFVAALSQLHTLRRNAAFPGWLATIARNRANDHHRRTQELEELSEDLAATGGPDAEAVTVLAVIRSLPTAYREPLILRLVEGMTGDEIAVRTGLRPASVRVNLHRGMKKLRERLGKEGRS
jgi:RNA polymerase sigma-70 factor (ECF subfamily)